jgi:hypothetical protein
VLGDDHRDTQTTWHTLVELLRHRSELEEARAELPAPHDIRPGAANAQTVRPSPDVDSASTLERIRMARDL